MPTPDPTEDRRAALSALMDGQPQAADEACRAWRDDGQSRADWHAYHLIGDLLRSDEHRCDAAHDALFVARLRERLAHEPVPLAPQSVVIATRRRRAGWMVPAAVAAGFVTVAGVLAVIRTTISDGAGDSKVMAGAPATSPAHIAGVQAASSASIPSQDNANMIRSAELDRYLAAHRQYANAAALAAPGGVVRSVAVAAPGR